MPTRKFGVKPRMTFRSHCLLAFFGGIALWLHPSPAAASDIVATLSFTSDTGESTEAGDTMHVTEPTMRIDVTKSLDEPVVHSRDFLLLRGFNWEVLQNTRLTDRGDTTPGDQIILHNVGRDAYVYFASDDESGVLPPESSGIIRDFATFPTGGGPYVFQAGLLQVPEPSTLFLASVGTVAVVAYRCRSRRRRRI